MIAASPVIFEREELLPGTLADSVSRDRWTALIPAAGRGTRLGFDRPKILYPVAGKPILDHLLDLLVPFCSRFVFVLSPAGLQPVQAALSPPPDTAISYRVQESPAGMADAVRCGLPGVETAHTLVIWGDQAGLSSRTVSTAARLHEGPLQPDATVPTVMRDRPYIHLDRDDRGRISRVLQAREGDPMPDRGESDSGIFLFRSEILAQYVPALFKGDSGAKTGEVNFLPIIPLLESAGARVVTARVVTEKESTGVNTAADADILSACLESRAS